MNATRAGGSLDGMHFTLLHTHPMGPFFGGHLIGGLLVALLIAFALSRLVRRGRLGPVRFDPAGRRPGGPRGWTPPTAEDAALATLRQRLASGDITVEEYLERSSVLRPSRPTDTDPERG